MPIMTTFDTPTPPPMPVPVLDYRPIVSYDPVPALDNIFRQTAHRAISIAIWLIVTRIVLALWPRSFDFTVYLLPAALACLSLAFPAAFISLCVARHRRQSSQEQRALLWTSLVLMIPTLIWMFLPLLSALLWKLTHQ